MGQFTERTTREAMTFIEDRVHNMSDAERAAIYISVANNCLSRAQEIDGTQRGVMVIKPQGKKS